MKSRASFLLTCASLISGAFLIPVASAQVGPPPPSGNVAFNCVTSVPYSPTVRAEGLTETVGDIILACVGGTPTALGAPLPTVNLSVVLNADITSRVYPGNWSEVELIVDEPNSGLLYTSNTQLACADPNGICTITGTGTGLGTYDGTSGRPNIFLGQVSGKTVTFANMPFDPASSSVPRIFRIANLRVNATTLSVSPSQAPLPVTASILFFGGTLSVPVTDASNRPVGWVTNWADLSLRSPDNSSLAGNGGFSMTQCNSAQRVGIFQAVPLGGGIFKRRSFYPAFVDSETSPAPVSQNVPGGIYNTESGFYNPMLAAPTVDFAKVGLADAGTRLRATISHIPNGTKIFVSTRNVAFAGAIPMPVITSDVARLVQNEAGAFVPMAATETLEGIPAAQLAVVNGSASAVWEVLGDLHAYFVIWAQSGTVRGSATFAGSYAPAPPAFAAAGAAFPSATLPVPRFVSTATGVMLFDTNACGTAAATSTTLTATSTGASHQYSLTATVTTPNPADTGAPAGTVTFYDNGVVIGSSATTLVLAATANLFASLASGPHRLSAVFTPANSPLFVSSTSPDLSLTSNNERAGASMDITSSNNPSLPGQAVTFIATVTGSGPTGSVQFADGSRSLGSATLIGGRASVTSTLTTVGSHDIFAFYSGDGGNTDASARFGQTVARVTDSLALTTSATTVDFGQPVTLTATLEPPAPAGAPAATGSVQFLEGAAIIGTATLTSRTATLTVSNLGAGAHPISAIYSGDANWYGTHSSPLTVMVSRTASSIVLTWSASITELRLTAALTPAAIGGSVQFFDTTGSATLGTTQPGNGTATLALAPADAAKIAGHAISAVYSGSTASAGSTSNPIVLPAVRNAAGGTSPDFAPEELVSLYGSGLLETDKPVVATAMAQTLGGLSVNIADATGAVFPAGLSYVSRSQVNFLMPAGLARGAALVMLLRGGDVVTTWPVTVARVAPGIFGASQMVHAESGAAYLVLYGTGIRNRSETAAVTCMVNGTALPVLYAGVQSDFAGLDQVNVPLPADLVASNMLSVSVKVDGQGSNVITIPMQ